MNNDSVKEALISEMERYFGEDGKRIDHARRVTGFAEEILKEEKGDCEVVLASAVLHDIGIHEAERKYRSTAGKYQEIEGPPIARNILEKLEINPERIDEICEIIAYHHTPGKVNSLNFKIVYDADWLVNLGDECNLKDKKKLTRTIDKIFLTDTGKRLAHKIYL